MKHDSIVLADKVICDSNNITNFCTNTIQTSIMNLFFIIIPTIYIISSDAWLALVLGITICLYFIAYKKFEKPLFEATFNYKNDSTNYIAAMNEQIRFTRNIKINSKHREFIVKFYDSFDYLYKSRLKINKLSYFFSGFDVLIMRASQIIIFFIGGYKIISGNITVGEIIIIINFFNMILNGIRYFFDLGKGYQEALVSYSRLQELMNIKKDIEGICQIKGINSISFVNFGIFYGEGKAVIENFNKKLVKGKIYAIIGRNGIGKSSLLYGMLGIFNDEYLGKLFYNDVNMKEINMEILRKEEISMLEQDDLIESDTVNSVLYSNISEEKIIQTKKLIEIFKLNSFLHEHSCKKIGSTFINISGGERKKILLIRALIKDASLLILDEPTSSLDIDATEKLFKYLQFIKNDKIIIIVSHEERISEECDEVIQFADNNYIK